MRRSRRAVVAAAAGLLALALASCGPIPQPWRKALVTATPSGEAANPGVLGPFISGAPVFSPDGTKIAFATRSQTMGSTDFNPGPDVYQRDVAAGTTTLVSVNAAGTGTGNRGSWSPSFNADGTKIAFQSLADDLGPTDTDPGRPAGNETARSDVYVRDLVANTTSLVSTNAAGSDSGELYGSFAPLFSPTEDKVAFLSPARDLGPGGVANRDLFIRDLVAGVTTLVSVDAEGTGGGDQGSGASEDFPTFVFSPDGTKLAFPTRAGNLVANDSNGGCAIDAYCQDIVVRDLVAGTTTLVSANASNTGSGNAGSWGPVFSPDGTKVVFGSSAYNLGAVDNNGMGDIYLRDLVSGTTTLVSANTAGTSGGNGWSLRPVFSPDGSAVAYDSQGSNFGPPDSNGRHDVYLRDLVTATTSLVSVNTTGTDGGEGSIGSSAAPMFSPDGARIAFTSHSADLVQTDRGACASCAQVFVRELATETTTLVSSRADGKAFSNGAARWHEFSPTQGTLAFSSAATDLGPTDHGGQEDIYIATLHGADLQARLTVGDFGGNTPQYSLDLVNNGPDQAEHVLLLLLPPDGVSVLGTSGAQCSDSPPPSSDVPPNLWICILETVAPGTTLSFGLGTSGSRAPSGATVTAITAVGAQTLDTAYKNNVVVLQSVVP